jgi:hypothetical protein
MHDSASVSSSTPNEKSGRLTASGWFLMEVERNVRGESFDVLGRWEAFSFFRIRKDFRARNPALVT